MNFNNKTVVIISILIITFLGGLLRYEQVLIAGLSGLIGFLANDKLIIDEVPEDDKKDFSRR